MVLCICLESDYEPGSTCNVDRVVCTKGQDIRHYINQGLGRLVEVIKGLMMVVTVESSWISTALLFESLQHADISSSVLGTTLNSQLSWSWLLSPCPCGCSPQEHAVDIVSGT